MKLALGTVQFGMDYGIANRTGQVPLSEIAAILATAQKAGVRTIDTAISYGESETRLGEAGITGFEVISKLPAGVAADDARGLVEAALARLGTNSLGGLLLHRSTDMVGVAGKALHAALLALKRGGLVGKIGVSIYDPAELDAVLEEFSIDLVQAPFNLFDRRLATSGWLERLKHHGVEVHTRSTFLQGLLLMPAGKRPTGFERWEPLLRRWDGWLEDTGQTAVAAALGFNLNTAGIARVLVGVDSLEHLLQILAAAEAPIHRAPDDLICNDLDLINPANWRRA